MAGSNLPTVRRFKYEDYPDAPKWFEQFLSGLNLFVDPIYQMVGGNIGYSNILAPQLYTVTITAPASGNVTFNFTNPLRISPSGVTVGNIYETGKASTHPTSPVSIFWHSSQGTIYVDQVTNLTATKSYVVTLIVF